MMVVCLFSCNHSISVSLVTKPINYRMIKQILRRWIPTAVTLKLQGQSWKHVTTNLKGSGTRKQA